MELTYYYSKIVQLHILIQGLMIACSILNSQKIG